MREYPNYYHESDIELLAIQMYNWQKSQSESTIKELTEALEDMVKMARIAQWDKLLTGRNLVLKKAEETLSKHKAQ
jgi:hypothetical protein